MDAGRRRTTLASYQENNHQGHGYSNMPMSMQSKRVLSGSSAVGGSSGHPGRQSLMPGGRFSMAVPQRVVSAGNNNMRQSLAPIPSHFAGSSSLPTSSSQQSHFNAPSTVARNNQMYHSAGIPSAPRPENHLRSSLAPQSSQTQQQSSNSSQGYAPPR